MSYDLGVWFLEQFLSDEQAYKLYCELNDGNANGVKPHSSIDAFYRELSNIHPEINNVPEDKIGDFDFSPWSIEHNHSDSYVLISCVWSHAEYVHKLVLNLAAKHKLAVFDPQLVKIYYPNNIES